MHAIVVLVETLVETHGNLNTRPNVDLRSMTRLLEQQKVDVPGSLSVGRQFLEVGDSRRRGGLDDVQKPGSKFDKRLGHELLKCIFADEDIGVRRMLLALMSAGEELPGPRQDKVDYRQHISVNSEKDCGGEVREQSSRTQEVRKAEISRCDVCEEGSMAML